MLTRRVTLACVAVLGGLGCAARPAGAARVDAGAQPAPLEGCNGGDAETALAERLREVALAGWVVRCRDHIIELRGEVAVTPMNAADRSSVERRSVTLEVAVSPFLSEEEQRALLTAAQQAERELRPPKALECDGMEFNDVFRDGLCFRPKTAAQERRVAEYWLARDRRLAVPCHHQGRERSVSIRARFPELSEGCAACETVRARVEALFTAYPGCQSP